MVKNIMVERINAAYTFDNMAKRFRNFVDKNTVQYYADVPEWCYERIVDITALGNFLIKGDKD